MHKEQSLIIENPINTPLVKKKLKIIFQMRNGGLNVLEKTLCGEKGRGKKSYEKKY
jgi:hypothetical protein